MVLLIRFCISDSDIIAGKGDGIMRKLQKLWIILFLGILFTAPVLLLIMPKQQYSISERRKLKTMPAITMDGILDKSCMQS